MKTEMIRFGNVENNRKAVLATIKQEGYIYFGISRCNLKSGDRFDRELGKKIATARAAKAINIAKEPDFKPDVVEFLPEDFTFYPYGRVKDTEIKQLLEYFHSLG